MQREMITTKKLDPMTVLDQVTRLACHYPNSGHGPETLATVAEDWFNSFKEEFTNEAFVQLISMTRRKAKFFPTEADIFQALGDTMMCKNCNYKQRKECDKWEPCSSYTHSPAFQKKYGIKVD